MDTHGIGQTEAGDEQSKSSSQSLGNHTASARLEIVADGSSEKLFSAGPGEDTARLPIATPDGADNPSSSIKNDETPKAPISTRPASLSPEKTFKRENGDRDGKTLELDISFPSQPGARLDPARHESLVADSGPLDDDTELHLEPEKPSSAKIAGMPRTNRSPQPAVPVDIGAHKMLKFSLYETSSRYYLVGGNITDDYFRILKIDRTSPPGQLNMTEDEVIYDKHQISSLLATIDEGNKHSGGMSLRCNTWGILGFIRFTEAYYMLIITKKQQVAVIGGHYIYQVDGTDLVPLRTVAASKSQSNKNIEEQRYLSIFRTLDLNRAFYFSYSYGVTRTLQDNIIQLRRDPKSKPHDHLNEMFVWNQHLLEPAVHHLKNPYDWCVPVIHGFVDQSNMDIFGKSVWVALIGRRSRFFAGARFLKRGVNDYGHVANDVETEQIVAEMDTTSLDAPNQRILKNPNYTSFVQHRGSIALNWTQEKTLTPKPAIELTLIDPFYSATALHFDHLFERYGAPVVVLNLVKQKERIPRETKLLAEYENALSYLNQFLPEDKRIGYISFDMSRAAKSPDDKVISKLEEIAEDVVHRTGFFHNGSSQSGETNTQNGVTRSNCIDCLDRTNACQFVVGKSAFALQLQALGLITGRHVNYDSDASNLLAHMYNHHGDTLASQYGGSHLVNTTDSYRKINNWQSQSRDMLESFKRYYHNSFLDSQRQDAYNLFLGNFRYRSDQPMLWEMLNDYYLHHALPRSFGKRLRRDYVNWFTPNFLLPRILPPMTDEPRRHQQRESVYDSAWWQEYYKPGAYTSFNRHFAYRVNSSTRYLPKHLPANHDRSPFVVRKPPTEPDHPSQKNKRASSKDMPEDPATPINPLSATASPHIVPKRITSLQQWLQELPDSAQALDEVSGKAAKSPITDRIFLPADKKLMHQWTVQQWYDNCMNPTVTKEQEQQYEQYLVLKGPLYQPREAGAGAATDYEDYVTKADQIGSLPLGQSYLSPVAAYENWLEGQPDDPLTITREDWESKRYKLYDRWRRGKDPYKGPRVHIESFPQS